MNLREAALQRLTNMQQEMERSITALRAALAQPETAAPQPAGPEDMAVYAAIAANYKAAPTVVEPDLFTTDIVPRPLKYPLSDYHKAMSEGPLHYTWQDKPHRLVYDLIAAVRYYTHPPRTALTRQRLQEVYENSARNHQTWEQFARDVEAAHGIGGKQ
jgi:hypothetical protein